MPRRRNGKEFSCEPCRKAKTRCDHGKPVCTKCLARKRASQCFYHPAPMTTQRNHNVFIPSNPGPRHSESLDQPTNSHDTSTRIRTHIQPLADSHETDWLHLQIGKRVLNHLQAYLTWHCCLVDRYFEVSQVRVVPKALAGMISSSIQSLITSLSDTDPDSNVNADMELCIAKISHQTSKTMSYQQGSTCMDYFTLFTGQNLRWDTIAIFLSLAGCVINLLPHHDPLLQHGPERQLALFETASLCIELWRLDGSTCDISVMSIYQNFIMTSLHQGDTDKNTWRRLADLTGALLEAELHQNARLPSTLPASLIQIRRRLFASAYSMDKSICTAASRSPMISSRFCQSILPIEMSEVDFEESISNKDWNPPTTVNAYGWSSQDNCSVSTWIRLRFLLASFREQLLASMQTLDKSQMSAQMQDIVRDCRSSWDNLPAHTKYNSASSQSCTDRQGLLLASIYLDYLFIQFQASYEMHHHNAEELSLINIAQTILSTVLEITSPLKSTEIISNGFSWIILFYGMPAAKLLVKALQRTLSSKPTTNASPLRRGELIRNVTSFLARLDLVIAWRDGNTESIKDAREALTKAFDNAVDGFEAHDTGSGITGAPSITTNSDTDNSSLDMVWSGEFLEHTDFFMGMSSDIWPF